MPDNLEQLRMAVQQTQGKPTRRRRRLDWVALFGRLSRGATLLGVLLLVGVAISVAWPHAGPIRDTVQKIVRGAPAADATAADATAPADAAEAVGDEAASATAAGAPGEGAAADPSAARSSPGRAEAAGSVNADAPSHQPGEVFIVGEWEYRANRVEWRDSLEADGDQARRPAPGRRFLVVQLTVCNISQAAAVLPAVRLAGPGGRVIEPIDTPDETDTSTLAPDRHHRRQVVFEVPPGKGYRLQLKGGWLSDRTAFVAIP